MHDRRSKVCPLHAGFEFPHSSISPSRISTVCNMQATVNYHVYRNSSDVEDKGISGAKTSSLARGADALSKKAKASENDYCRALKHVSLMFIISA